MHSTTKALSIFTLLLLSILPPICASAQKLEVESMEILPKDITARTNSRVDLRGNKCALIKVCSPDGVAKVLGNVIGEISGAGMERWIYLTHDTKQMELMFDHYLPLHINFIDHDFVSVSSGMTYRITLRVVPGSVPSYSTTSQPASQASDSNVDEIISRAKEAFVEGYYQSALDLLKTISHDAEAQALIGIIYVRGSLGNPDYAEALKWLRPSAEQNNPTANLYLGYLHENGYGIDQNYFEAVRLYRKAAEQGEAIAQNNLGCMYYYGYGVNKDYNEALRWYRRSAEQGYTTAQTNIGFMYREGLGVKKNKNEARKWYQLAAEKGDEDAKKILKKL